ncbi:hypothetical protein ACIOEX_16290 [Streptomyces sp. NPDC087850]|uniref:hypothetical protein n=1 Tax=Streptomyces sp. NPDC087850 TaxID=3365809 RepID=UPI0037F3B35D
MSTIRRGLSVATALAAAGLALSVTTAPASASTGGLLHLMVKTNSDARSVYVSTSKPFGESFTACRTLNGGAGWKDGHQDLFLGKNVKLITFTSANCTAGFLTSRDFTLPAETSENNFWADMT